MARRRLSFFLLGSVAVAVAVAVADTLYGLIRREISQKIGSKQGIA